VLAGGKSTRFGENKLLYKLKGKTIIERVVESAIESEADEVLIVLGYEAERLRRTLSGTGCSFVNNPSYEEGQSSSVKTGISSLLKDSEATLILPGDIALISSRTINKVIEEYERTRSPIVVATYRGRLGHPILFDRSLFREITNINEEKQGLRAIVKKYWRQINKIEVGSPEILFDIDTKKDIDRISNIFND
jgi:molybdenum cofactor cytidylyltransferase